MFPNKYDFHLTEKSQKTSYWKGVVKQIPNNFTGTLLLPPPNITGNLHLGHALDSITQDFLVRFAYLTKEPIYWIAGMDHAGISTQSKIENLNLTKLDTWGKKREYTFQVWYPKNRKIFYQQWEKLGLLIDYEKASFTLDSAVQKQIRKAFVKLYQDGLIYRGTRLVNWDPKLKSVISDIEVEHKPSKSKLYYLKYPLLDNNELSFARVIIQNKEGKILVLKDKKWGRNFPGGKIKVGETPEEAAKREVWEETNLVIGKLKKVKEKFLLFNNKWIDNQWRKGYYYWTNEYSGEIKDQEPKKISNIKFMDKTSQEALHCAQFVSKSNYLKMLDGEETSQAADNYLLVATSRPETIFADVALFVNPDDQRYQKYQGWKIKHPWTGKIIPILTDKSIKMDFGTGVLKCTPGHDFTDYELGKKHQLPVISCCDEKGILNELTGRWQGQEISSIRKEFLMELERRGICMEVKEYETNLSYSAKSEVLIEPLLSQQWFLDLSALIKKVEQKQPNFLFQIEFVPNKFQKVLKDWSDKAQQWCISRQLWWGHQIPAWHHKKTGEIYVGEESPNCACRELFEKRGIKSEHDCLGYNWESEKDVLDTWFSSGLWPLVALAKEGDKFPPPLYNWYPITTLVTGYDILFFWVLKMILLGTYFTGKVPFQKILLHGLIRDKHGKKMSKSLGNGVDPDELISKYGRDSLRLFLLENNIWGSDLIYNEDKMIGSWRFCQKLWSIANLITSKIPATELRKVKKEELETLPEQIL